MVSVLLEKIYYRNKLYTLQMLLGSKNIGFKYRVSIKSFPDYKYLLQENYRFCSLCNCNITINTWHKILETNQ